MRRWLVSLGGVGLLPAMPGTYASLAAAIVFYGLWWAFGDAARWITLVLLFLVAIAVLRLAPWAEEHFKSRDPRQFVLDEVVGQWATLLFIPLSGHVLSSVIAGFFLFRGFDVAKPFPIKRIEALPGGWGIVLDDVAAALYAALGFWILLFVTTAALPKS